MKTVSASNLQHENGGPVSERVLAAVATRDRIDPLDFDQRLYDVIDPDALNALFRSDSMNGRVTFTYLGYEVTVHDDGEITLDPVDG